MDCKNCILFKHACEGKMTIRRQKEQKSKLKFLLSHPDPNFYVSKEFNSTTKQIFDRWTREVKGDIVFTKNCVQAKHITKVGQDRKARASCQDTLMKDLEGAEVIVACGQWALEALGFNRSPSSSVGWVGYHEELQASVLVTHEPLEVEDYPGHQWKDFVWTIQRAEDIVLGKAPKTNILPPLEWKKITSLAQLETLTQAIPDGDLVGADIETGGLLFYDEDQAITQIGMYHPEMGAVVIPAAVFIYKGFGRWLAKFAKRCKMVLHNSKFDSKFIEHKLTTQFNLDKDTIFLHHMIDERTRRHGLERLVRVYLNWTEYWLELKKYPAPKSEGYRWVPFDVSAQYLAYDCYGTWLLANKFLDMLRDDTSRDDLPWDIFMSQRDYVEKILVPVNNELRRTELNGIRIDKAKVERLIQETEPVVKELKEDIEDKLYEILEEEVDINSPVQLLPALKKAKILPVTADSVDKHTLEDHVDNHVVAEILKYRKDQKVLTTYYRGTQEKLVRVSQETYKIFPRFSIVGTVGTRWSSSGPNFQQSPRQGPFKTLIIPNKGHIIFSNDFSGLEARSAAFLSGDKVLAAACVADLHQTVAEKAFDKFFKQIDQLDNLGEVKDFALSHPMLLSTIDTLETKVKSFEDGVAVMRSHLRSCAKAITFGIFFGRGARALAEKELMCSVGEAQQFIDDYFTLFPKLHEWICEVRMLVRKEGIIICPDGTTRDLRGWLFSPNLMSRKRALAKAERQAVNILTQGFAGTINNMTYVRTGRYLRETGQGALLGAVHDSTVGELLLHEDYSVTEHHLNEIKKLGETVFHSDIIKFAMDSEVGFNLGEVKEKDRFFAELREGRYLDKVKTFQFAA